jgi:hypothetical protein
MEGAHNGRNPGFPDDWVADCVIVRVLVVPSFTVTAARKCLAPMEGVSHWAWNFLETHSVMAGDTSQVHSFAVSQVCSFAMQQGSKFGQEARSLQKWPRGTGRISRYLSKIRASTWKPLYHGAAWGNMAPNRSVKPSIRTPSMLTFVASVASASGNGTPEKLSASRRPDAPIPTFRQRLLGPTIFSGSCE